jgi:hypothetical protein
MWPLLWCCVPHRRVKEDLEVASSRTREGAAYCPCTLKTCPVHGVTKTDPCDQREDKFPLVTGCLILRDARQRGYSYRVCIRVVLNTTAYYVTRSFLISHFSKSALLRDHSRKSKRVLLKINIVSQRQGSYFWSRERPEKLAKQNYKKKSGTWKHDESEMIWRRMKCHCQVCESRLNWDMPLFLVRLPQHSCRTTSQTSSAQAVVVISASKQLKLVANLSPSGAWYLRSI